MLRQSLLVLLASLLVIFFATEVAFFLNYLDRAHLLLVGMLGKVFAGGTIGSLVRNCLALFLIPFVVALIPTLLYLVLKKGSFKYFPHVLWVGWIILATLIVAK